MVAPSAAIDVVVNRSAAVKGNFSRHVLENPPSSAALIGPEQREEHGCEHERPRRPNRCSRSFSETIPRLRSKSCGSFSWMNDPELRDAVLEHEFSELWPKAIADASRKSQ